MQKKKNDKNKRFKELIACTEEEERTHKKESYKEAKQAKKKAVVEVKGCVYKDLY